jgi:hypothetical protein
VRRLGASFMVAIIALLGRPPLVTRFFGLR